MSVIRKVCNEFSFTQVMQHCVSLSVTHTLIKADSVMGNHHDNDRKQ